MRNIVFFCLITVVLIKTPIVTAKAIYQKNNQFISDVFRGKVPKTKMYWLSKADKIEIAEMLGHKYYRLRIRYWQKNAETVWILDEVGKEKPITIGVQISHHQISQLKVLTYRESRGDEVRHVFFTQQFNAIKLTKNNKLSRIIDGITGATMSVHALTKVARLALWLDKKIISKTK